MRRLSAILALVMVLATSATAGATPPRASLATSANGLGFKLFSRLAAQSPQSNVLMSPASVGLALDVVFDAARGTTRSELAAALGLGAMSTAQQERSAAALVSGLSGSADTAQLDTSTSFWTRKQAPIRPAFEKMLQHDYRAEARSLDFGSPSAVPTINNWVSKATQGKIPRILSNIPANVIAYLINAVYFQGQWTVPFVPSATSPHSFAGMTGTVPMMHQSGTLKYYGDKSVQVVSLPYGKQPRFDMVVVLPRPGIALQKVIGGLTPAIWQSWTSRLTSGGMVDLGLPRFSFSRTMDLKPDLQALGIRSIFQKNSANLSGMCLQRCWVTNVRHKTYIAVDENGTVAAAATSVGIGATAVPGFRAQMVVDRPFLIAIRDQVTGSVLFLGAVRKP